MADLDDFEQIQEIKMGGARRVQAISALYRKYAPRFAAYFRKHRLDSEEAEDLAQDAFVKIIRACGTFEAKGQASAWLWQIARNCMMDHFRRRTPETGFDDDALEALMADNVEMDLQGAGEAQHLQDCVQRAFTAFASEHGDRAHSLRLVCLEGWSISDVAVYLKRTEGATREYLSQCRKRLRPYLEACREFLYA